jgi:hypothetical protein
LILGAGFVNPTRTQVIKSFLEQNTLPDLASLYNYNMEVQVLVAQDTGERIEDEFQGVRWQGWRGVDGSVWKSFRIPYKASTEPEYDDKPMAFDLAVHALGIGMTGWDWVNKLSRWVAFDFDAIIGHSEKHAKKLSESELEDIQKYVKDIDWVTIRRSTSGKGIHLYIDLIPYPTANHTEHAALARSILGMLSARCRFDFQSKADQCGGNMWIWHRKMVGTNGLQIIKPGTRLGEIPANWRDHTEVVSGRRRRNRPAFVEDIPRDDKEQMFDELTAQRMRVKLDDAHVKLRDYLEQVQHPGWWDHDHHMLITHTIYLKEAHEALSMIGPFETKSLGSDRNTPNCFAFPIRNGGWSVRRYTLGVEEASTWKQDGRGWTQCFLNKAPDLEIAARACEGVELKSGGWVFKEADVAVKAANMLGAYPNIPSFMGSREAVIQKHKDGKRIVMTLAYNASVDRVEQLPGWHVDGKKATRIYETKAPPQEETEVANYDESIRHLVTETGSDYGWMLNTSGQWRSEPLEHLKIVLKGAFGFSPKEVNVVLGGSIFQYWTLVNRPFEDEYPPGSGREWNRNAPQLRFHPSDDDSGKLSYPTWMRILRHCGKSLDNVLANNQWAKSNGILTGADYLKCWIASMFKDPLQPLPYLFLYSSEQDTGKSILHEALSVLMTTGVVRSDNALISPSGFNGELENAVLCVIEETDLRQNKTAYNRIKDWVTSIALQIHKKQQTPYSIKNSCHFIQCANRREYCPVFPGDTRITMLHVEGLQPDELIPKRQILILLEKEAPDFLAEILDLEIPESGDRLNIPAIETPDKLDASEANLNDFEAFLRECCYHVTGKSIKFRTLYERFMEWEGLASGEERFWTDKRVGKSFPPHFTKGRLRANSEHYVGNISFEPYRPGDPILPRLINVGGYLESESNGQSQQITPSNPEVSSDGV